MEGRRITTEEWYDFIALMSDFMPDLHPGGIQATMALLDRMKIDPDEIVLDVGCGSGATACMIAGEYQARVVGIDLSREMVEKAATRATELGVDHLVEFKVMDIRSMTFEPGTFDAALFQSVLTPFPGDPNKAMAEIVRVLKAGGRAGGNEGTLLTSASRDFIELTKKHPGIRNSFTYESIHQLFESAGLKSILAEEHPLTELPGVRSNLTLRKLLSFMVKVYPRILWNLITNPRMREITAIDNQVTKLGTDNMGYTLITGEK